MTARASPDSGKVFELRRYALKPGQRDTLIDLFDREFVETQEAVGMCIFGQFRDLDDPDSFVWMRGFADMETRKKALESFYGGPVWKQHGRAANATMVDSDNVLLLQPVSPLDFDRSRRASPGIMSEARGLLAVTICPLAQASTDDVPLLFRRVVEPTLRVAGITVLATYITDPSENTFPALPVREDRTDFVWMSMFEDEADHAQHVRVLEQSSTWRDASQTLAAHRAGDEEVLRLRPTRRSAIQALMCEQQIAVTLGETDTLDLTVSVKSESRRLARVSRRSNKTTERQPA
jgi:quinol monooxygenase YgiN